VLADDGRKIRVLVVDDVPETRENIRKLLLFEKDIEVVGMAADGAQAIEAAKKLRPDVILMDINMPGMDGIAAAEAINLQVPESQVIMMSVQSEADYLRRSMLAGAREFLIKPFTSDELAQSIRRVHELGAARRELAPAPAPPPPPAAPPQAGKIFAIFSPKGGTGRTIVAVNLAIALKMETGKRVALVDGNLQLGDVAVMLNMSANKNIADLVNSSGEVDGDLIEEVLQTHSSGVRVLLAPPRPEMAELVTADLLKKVLLYLRSTYDYVIVDTWNSFQDQVLTILDLADRIVLLMTMEIPTIKNIKIFLEVADALGYSPEKILLVLNRSDSRGGISLQDIQHSIDHPIVAGIVSDGQLTTAAINRGIPFVISHKDSQIARNIFAVARLLLSDTPVSAAVPAKKGIFGKVLG